MKATFSETRRAMASVASSVPKPNVPGTTRGAACPGAGSGNIVCWPCVARRARLVTVSSEMS